MISNAEVHAMYVQLDGLMPDTQRHFVSLGVSPQNWSAEMLLFHLKADLHFCAKPMQSL